MYKLVLILIGLCCLQLGSAQTFRAEQIFLSPERESCMPGDTLRVSGQLLSTNHQDFYPYSRYIYLECIDQKDSLLLRQKVACDERGYFYTAVPTQFEWESNICYLRAYTRLMQNYSIESFAVAPFLLGAIHPKKKDITQDIHGVFYPEGGKLLNGFQQNVVFRLTDDDGFPISTADAFLLDEKNDTIRHHIIVSENGLGKMTFLPEASKQYRLLVEYNNRFFTFPLQTDSKGASLQAVINRERLSCRLLSNEEGKHYRLFLYHSHKGLQEIPFHTGQKVAAVELSNYPKGILVVFLMDKDLNLLSERLLWLEKPEVSQTTFNCSLSQRIVSPQSPLQFQLDSPHNSTVFIRIAQQDDLLATQAYSSFWLGGEILSPVRFPLINSQIQEEQETELNQWLYTARFILFSPETVLKEGINFPYPIEDGLFLKGTAWKRKDKPFGPGLIDAQNKKDLSFYTGEINQEGDFVLPVDNYPEGTGFLLISKNNKGKTVNSSFTLAEETYPKIIIPNPLFTKTRLQTDIIVGDTIIRYSVDEDQQRIYHIDNITVQSRKSANIQEMSRTPNNFIGEKTLKKWPGKSVRSLLNNFTAIKITKGGSGSGEGIIKRQNALARNQSRISNGEMRREEGETTITWKASGKYSFFNGDIAPLNVVINGEVIFSNIDHILEWAAGDIKSIELIRPTDTRCTIYGTPNGAIAIETLKEPRIYENDPLGEMVYPFGLTITDKQPAKHIKAPSQPGKYRLLIDVITDDKRIISFNKEFEVK
ncbi:hypothetical protein [Parabacteroides faecis]|nr:hypothetical protein [Parabacteroides faecis]